MFMFLVATFFAALSSVPEEAEAGCSSTTVCHNGRCRSTSVCSTPRVRRCTMVNRCTPQRTCVSRRGMTSCVTRDVCHRVEVCS
jgi:hypothetical protein